MDSTDSTTVILECDLGDVASFDPLIFPRAYYECEGNLDKGCFLIEATLDEMNAIKELGIDLNKNGNFIYNTRLKLEASVLVYGPCMSAHR